MTAEDPPFEAELRLAIERYCKGDLDGACDDLQGLVERFPDAAAVHGCLANYQHLAKRYERALPHARRAVQLAPRHSASARQLVLTLFELGRYEEAREEVSRFSVLATSDQLGAEWALLQHSVDTALRRRGT